MEPNPIVRMNLKERYKKPKELKRKHLQVFLMNDREVDAFNLYCRKYKITNKSKLVRDFVFKSIIGRLSDDYPTLFSDEEMERMVRQ